MIGATQVRRVERGSGDMSPFRLYLTGKEGAMVDYRADDGSECSPEWPVCQESHERPVAQVAARERRVSVRLVLVRHI